jgi:hypothetical protein
MCPSIYEHGNPGQVLDFLLSIPGEKIVTIGHRDHRTFEVDVHSDGSFGYDDFPGGLNVVKRLFDAHLRAALEGGGALVIRQFLGIKVKAKVNWLGGEASPTEEGKVVEVPMKAIFMFRLFGGQAVGVTSAEAKEASEVDAATRRRLPPEFGVVYVDTVGWNR